MKTIDLYGLGNALVDYECRVDERWLSDMGLQKGVTTLVEEAEQARLLGNVDPNALQRACGGSGANSVIAAAQMGASAFYSCKVADDEDGRFYLQDMNAAGVQSSDNALSKESGVTGKCMVMVTDDADRTMATYLGITTSLSYDCVDETALKNARYLYIEGYLVSSEQGKQTAIKAKQVAHAAGVPVALSLSDPNMVQFFKDGFVEMIGEGVDILFANEEEAMMMTNADSAEAALVALKPMAKQVAITLGGNGSLVFDGEQVHHIAPVKTDVIDTLGAGDMFAGAFLFGLIQGWTSEKAGRLASLASARLVAHFGPRFSADAVQSILQAFNAE